MIGAIRAAIRRRRLMARHDHLAMASGAQAHDSLFGHHVELGANSIVLNSSIGDWSYIGANTVLVHAEVGRFCSIARDVQLGTGSHPATGTVAMHPIFYLARPEKGWTLVDQDRFQDYQPTRVGHDVWIGAKVIVRDGVTIGDGAIVGAGAVVVKPLEPYGVYAGSPARLLRFRFPEPMIADLLAYRWWNKDQNWLRAHAALFTDPDAFARLIAGASKPDQIVDEIAT